MEPAWSVRLRANGYHESHIHPHGWVSCASYATTPAAVRGVDRPGWLKLGEAPEPLQAAFPAQRFVEPEPGLLVLFPSYMWRGAVPFTTQEMRLSVAFDILPARQARRATLRTYSSRCARIELSLPTFRK